MSIKVIALGNELRRDDGVALVACRTLPPSVSAKADVIQLGIHADQIKDFVDEGDDVIILDAVMAPNSAGNVALMAVDSANQCINPKYSHGFSWLDELQFYGAPDHILFVAIYVGDDGWGEGLTPAVESAIPTVHAAVDYAIRDCELANA